MLLTRYQFKYNKLRDLYYTSLFSVASSEKTKPLFNSVLNKGLVNLWFLLSVFT